MPPVLTKQDFVKRYALGEFGNCSPTWNSYEEWVVANPNDKETIATINGIKIGGTKYHIRNRIQGAMTWYDVPSYEMFIAWDIACGQFEPHNLYISAMAPTHLTTLQGYLSDRECGLRLAYSTVKKPMRDSLIEGEQHAWGQTVKLLLQQYLNHNSYNWLQWLLEAYPNHTVEFSCYSRCWGNLSGYNTVFWEVRAY